MRIIAIDQGTTSTRALVFEDDATPRVAAVLRHRQLYPRPGWVEHDPRELCAHVESCLVSAGPADAIGLANQGESCLAWDARTLEPLSPVIVWQDQRTADAVAALAASDFAEEVSARPGLPPVCYFSASKLAWLSGETADVRAARRRGTLRLGTTDSFLLERLTGELATDPTTASRTSLLNLATLTWDPLLCDAFGVPIETLAPLRPTTGPFGAYEGMPVRTSVVDQQAALYGHGCREYGEAKVTFGTGAFALVLAGDTPPERRGSGLSATVAWQIEAAVRYALEGGVYDAGAAIEWAMRIGLLRHTSELAALMGQRALDSGVVFVPALSGLACPQWSRAVRGMWTGLTTATTREDLQRSLLEGIALQMGEVLGAVDEAIGRTSTVSVDGGLTASPYFLQFLADVTGRTIIKSHNSELTSWGCALLAGHTADGAWATAQHVRYASAIGADARRTYVERYRAAIAGARRPLSE